MVTSKISPIIPLFSLPGIEVHLSRKPIKNINLRINRQGQVSISAPLACPLGSIQQFLHQKQHWIRAHQARLQQQQPITRPSLPSNARQTMQALLPDLIQKWETHIGVKAEHWTIKAMKSRWGSCNTLKKRICLNLYLMQYPQICLEYVIVHELVHLLEASHNRRFYALMSRFMPGWQEYKGMLKDPPFGLRSL